jgi:hypothetical protein
MPNTGASSSSGARALAKKKLVKKAADKKKPVKKVAGKKKPVKKAAGKTKLRCSLYARSRFF